MRLPLLQMRLLRKLLLLRLLRKPPMKLLKLRPAKHCPRIPPLLAPQQLLMLRLLLPLLMQLLRKLLLLKLLQMWRLRWYHYSMLPLQQLLILPPKPLHLLMHLKQQLQKLPRPQRLLQ
jgi:hypothetical protein